MSGEGGTSCEVELVSCSLSELSSCLCLREPSSEVGSGRRKNGSHSLEIPTEEIFLTAKRAFLRYRPTLIDHLIHRNRAALEMGPKKSKGPTGNVGVKRKKESEASVAGGPLKKMKGNCGPEGESQKKRSNADASKIRPNKKKLTTEPGTNRYATRISSNKVRIPLSLRSGRKLVDILKKRKMKAGSSLNDANGIKSGADSSKKDSSVKKELGGVKKASISKKGSTLMNKTVTVKKSAVKSDVDGSATSEKTAVPVEGEVKKKRRRKRCSMWVNKVKRVKKKESETNDETGEPAELTEDEEEDDDESGQVSDTSMLSIATQDSALMRIPNAVEEVKGETGPNKEESEKSEYEKPPILVDEQETAKKKDEAIVKEESAAPDTIVKENEEKVVPSGPLPKIMISNNGESDEVIESSKVVKHENDLSGDSSGIAAVEGQVNSICLSQDVDTDVAAAASSPMPVVGREVAKCFDVPPFQGVELPVKDQPTELVITKCESLANTPLESSALKIAETSFKPPLEHSIKEETCKVVTDENFEVSQTETPSIVTAGDDVETELRRDADSTTCDNPRGLDDSFDDLTLYVSEEDLTNSKDHDERLPDSTNVSQVEPPCGEDVAFVPEVESVLHENDKSEPLENLTEEQKQMKESVLQALGLKSLSGGSGDVPEEKPKRSDGYTGTLKAVIKLNRSGDKKHMVYKRSENDLASSNKLEYRICSEMADEKFGEKKLSEDHVEEVDEEGSNEEGAGKESNLIIPEKSSSFSIHPGRLCSDVCSYCFGKFGSLDTPCHVAQLKGEERQRKILENEPHLTGESCLCDACYRYVDRKANFPEKLKVGRLKPPAQASVCCVTHCSEPATRTIKRKWLIKLKKSITNKLNIDMEKLGHGVYYPFCTQHHYWVEYFTICGICRKRLNRNNLFSLGSEADRLNLMLAEDGIPARLSVNLFLCKLCRYYADLRLKYPDPTAIPNTNQNFYKNYRRKILMSLDIPVSDSDDELLQPQEVETKTNLEGSRDDSKTSEDVMSLSGLATLLGEQPQQQARIQVKFGNVNIGTLSNLNIGQQGGSAASSATSSTGNVGGPPAGPNMNGSSNHKNEPTYPEVNLIGNLEYQGPNTPDGSWERYQSTLQFDRKTKQLWTELQRPYGSQTSFLRHLVMLERVWRDGYLVLAPDADEAASRYVTSARNRIKAFETQGPKMQTSTPPVTIPVSAPNVHTPPSTVPAPVSRPAAPTAPRKSNPVQTFPFLTNTGEIEVTPIRTNKPSPNQPPPHKPPVAQQRPQVSVSSHRNPSGPPPRKITPLDRAKSLVRMAPMYQQIQQHVSGDRRPVPGTVRFMGSHSSIPPLVRLPQTTPNQFYQPPQQQMFHPQMQPHVGQQQFFPAQPRAALPRLPKNLTVMSMPTRTTAPQAITLSHAGITIEKQMMAPMRTSTLPIERPSISVFREPATP